MTQPPSTVKVEIFGKIYQVSCPNEQRAELEQSAEMLDQQMRHIRNHANVVGLERIAVIAALNLTHELLQKQQQLEQLELELGTTVEQVSSDIDTVLSANQTAPKPPGTIG